jgi:hypothetical protein
MISHLYRFRSVRQLLDGFHELERQQIYFCPPTDLNDPVEGFKDLFWLGDEIVWRNLLKHYVLCLIELAPVCFTGASDCGRGVLQNIVLAVPDELPDSPARTMYNRVAEAFLSEAPVHKFVEVMASRTTPIRRSELTHYLGALHPFALDAVFEQFAEHGVMTMPRYMSGMNAESFRENVVKVMEGASQLPRREYFTEERADAFFSAMGATSGQLDLINEYQMKDRAAARPLMFFCRYFPATYVGALNRLVHPDWYVACFSANPTNASMWGTYGDGHRGVCLKFKTSPNSLGMPTLSLNKVTGLGGTKDHLEYHWNSQPCEFRKVEYTPAYPPIDFFRSLGSISQEKLHYFWYRGENN